MVKVERDLKSNVDEIAATSWPETTHRNSKSIGFNGGRSVTPDFAKTMDVPWKKPKLTLSKIVNKCVDDSS